MSFDWSKHARPNGEWVTFDTVGDKVVGTVVRIREHTFDQDKGPVPIVDIDTGGPESMSLSCAPANLRAQLAELEPQIGDRLGVRFVGTEKLPGRPQPLKKFDVRILERAAVLSPASDDDADDYSDAPF